MTTTPSAPAREIARHLLVRESTGTAGTPTAIELQHACTRLAANLRRSLGDYGFNALLVRAITATQDAHPVLTDLCRVCSAGLALDNVVVGVERHGLATVTAGVEAALAALVDILGGLIGVDMVPHLLDLDSAFTPTPDIRLSL